MANFTSIESAKQIVRNAFETISDYATLSNAKFEAVAYLELHWGFSETKRFQDRLYAKYNF